MIPINTIQCTIGDDELPMTMQVGMVAGDSVVLAGDTRWTMGMRFRCGQDWAGGRYGEISAKMRIHHERGIAIACSGNMQVAMEVADKINLSLSEDDFGSPEGAIKAIVSEMLPNPTESDKAQWMIVLQRPSVRLFLLQFVANINGNLVLECREMGKFCITGDNTNCAIFWAERYHKKTSSVDEAIFLGAHLVTCAGALNPGGIEGLEIVVCRPSGIELLSKAEIGVLESRSIEHDKRIGELILVGAR